MADFGQRYTFGYDTYNVIFNIGTMGHILIFFMVFAGVIYAIKKFFIYNEVGKKQVRYYQFWFHNLISNDLLMLLLCCFFEFGAASLVAINNYDSETNSIWNLVISVSLLVAITFGIPFIFKLNNQSRKVGRQTGKDLGVAKG
jgi:hypothetical protein